MTYRQAEWYDAFAFDYWRAVEPQLRTVLRPWRGEKGLAVDLGAGTGLATMTLAQTCAGEVLACEPEPALRVGIMGRVVSDDGYRSRVTVLPWAAEALVARLDEPVAVMTAISMFEHLDAQTRRQLLRWAGAHLTEAGCLVVGPFYDGSAARLQEEVPRDPQLGEQFTCVEVGRLRYTGWARYADKDEHRDQPRWHMTWQVHCGAELLDERQADFADYSVSRAQLAQEAAEAGLCARNEGPFVLLQQAS